MECLLDMELDSLAPVYQGIIIWLAAFLVPLRSAKVLMVSTLSIGVLTSHREDVFPQYEVNHGFITSRGPNELRQGSGYRITLVRQLMA